MSARTQASVSSKQYSGHDLRQLAIASLVVVLLIVGVWWWVARPPSGKPQPHTLRYAGPCANPPMVLEDRSWSTSDFAPDDWDLGEGVEGTLYLDGKSATFVGPDGHEISYKTGGLDRLDCWLR